MAIKKRKLEHQNRGTDHKQTDSASGTSEKNRKQTDSTHSITDKKQTGSCNTGKYFFSHLFYDK